MEIKRPQNVAFLCGDDFGIKYHNKDDVNNLLNALKQVYQIYTERTGANCICLNINWKYSKKYADISIPLHVMNAIQKFQHTPPERKHHAPQEWTELVYGKKIQYALLPSILPVLDKVGTRRIQGITWNFLYYARAVDPLMLLAINKISFQQETPTQDTNNKVQMLIEYVVHNPILQSGIMQVIWNYISIQTQHS